MTQQTSSVSITGRAAISTEESRKRQVVFTRSPETILVKVLAMGPLSGLSEKRRDEAKVVTNHVAEAKERGLNPDAYQRPVPDTGFCLFEKEAGVRVIGLLTTIEAAGFVFTGGHWFQDANGKGPVNVLTFTKKAGAKAEVVPAAVRSILTVSRFNNCTVWCNLRTDQETGRQFRLDTINLAKGRVTDEPSRTLAVEGNSYQLT